MPKKSTRRKINVLSIFQEIKQIQSPALRQGVLKVWNLAISESGEKR
jgi:hypothetical protein